MITGKTEPLQANDLGVVGKTSNALPVLEKALTANPDVSGVSSDPTGAAPSFPDNSLECAGGAGWQPIGTAPKDWVPILVWAYGEEEQEDAEDEDRDPRRTVMVATHSAIKPGNWWLHQTMQAVYEPTHWMPLPAAPTFTNGGPHEPL
jgi:hypothetical protein